MNKPAVSGVEILRRRAPFSEFFKRSGAAVQASLLHFPLALRRCPLVAGFLAVYTLLRFGVNYWHFTASLGSALISAVMALLVHALILLLMDAIHFWRYRSFEDASLAGTRWEKGASLKALLVVIAVWDLWLLLIIHNLQSTGALPGRPLFSLLPGWSSLAGLLWAAAEQVHRLLPAMEAAVYHGHLLFVLFIVLLPLALLRLCGFGWRDFGLNFKGWQVAAPVLALGGVMLALNGLTPRLLLVTGLALAHPGLTEELLYRGLMQRALSGFLRGGNAILVTALLFSLLHFPNYYYNLYGQDLWHVALSMGDVALAGLYWGYGFRRSGGVLPWVGVHALSDIVGI